MPIYKPLTDTLEVNKELPFYMHIDMNSFFASCEQQENPLLRGKPVGVVPYVNDRSTIIAASYQAKALGIKTGTKVIEAKKLCPNIKFVLADPPKYRYINKKFMKVFKKICPDVHAKSIDEAYLNFKKVDLESLKHKIGFLPNREEPYLNLQQEHKEFMTQLAKYIKLQIKKEVGEYINCSIGVGTNTFMAKVASGIKKPDGFYYVDHTNLHTFYDILELEDLHGIAGQMHKRLNKINIYSCSDFLNADIYKLKAEFKFFGFQWYLRLRGFECDDVDFKRKNVGHSFHLTKWTNNESYLKAVILKLTEKTTTKLRRLGYEARCFSLYLIFSEGGSYSKSHRLKVHINSTKDIYKEFMKLYFQNPYPDKKIRIIGLSTSYLRKHKQNIQYDLFGENIKKQKFNKAIDSINNQYGAFTLYPGTLVDYKEVAPDRIAFGK